MNNPYQSPQSRLAQTADGNIDEVAAGQKLVIFAILGYFVAVFSQILIGSMAIVIALAAFGLALAGIFKLGSGMGFSTLNKAICVLLMFVPLVGLLMLLVLNSKATSRLRAAGYTVGFLGAQR